LKKKTDVKGTSRNKRIVWKKNEGCPRIFKWSSHNKKYPEGSLFFFVPKRLQQIREHGGPGGGYPKEAKRDTAFAQKEANLQSQFTEES